MCLLWFCLKWTWMCQVWFYSAYVNSVSVITYPKYVWVKMKISSHYLVSRWDDILALSIINTGNTRPKFVFSSLESCCLFFFGYGLHNLPSCQVQNKRSRCCFTDAFGLLWLAHSRFWSVARAKAEYSTTFENSIFFSPFQLRALLLCWMRFVRMDADKWVRIIPSNTPLNCTKDSRIDYVRSIYLCFYLCCYFYWVLFQCSKSVTHILCFTFTPTFFAVLLFRISE